MLPRKILEILLPNNDRDPMIGDSIVEICDVPAYFFRCKVNTSVPDALPFSYDVHFSTRVSPLIEISRLSMWF